MRGVALNERVRVSVKEPGRVETGKSRLYLPEDGEGGRARRRRDGGVGAGGESRLPTGVAGYKSASASAPAIISIPPSLHPPSPLLLLRRSTMKIVSEKQCHLQRRSGKKTLPSGPGLSCARRPDKLCQGLWCLGRTRVPTSRPRRPGGRSGGVKKKKKVLASMEFGGVEGQISE